MIIGTRRNGRRRLFAICTLVSGVALLAPALSAQLVPYRAGWPVSTGKLVDRSSPAVGNLDGDADLEIVVGSIDHKVYAFNPNGTAVPGWPVTVTAEVNSSPAIGDIDGDGFNEVVVGAGWQDLANDGAVYVFRRNGQLMPGWPFITQDANLGQNGHSDGVFASPALADLDGDGRLEILVGTFDQNFYALRHDGTVLWSFFMMDSTWSSPAVGDLDGDHQPEVVIAAYTHPGTGLPVLPGSGILWVVDRQGQVKPGWPVLNDLHFDSSPALGDLDGDGDLEIVIGTGHEPNDPGMRGRNVWAFHHNGSVVAGWPAVTTDFVWPSPALADLDGDGRDEVVVACTDSFLYAWDGNGTLLPGWPVQPLNESLKTGGMAGSPVVADLDGNGDLEILQAIGWDVVGFNHNGTQFKYATAQVRMRTLFSVGGTPTIADLDGNNRLDVILGSADGTLDNGKLYAWELPVQAVPGAMPWPKWRKNSSNLGGPPLQNLIFADGFESGNLSAW